jgi:aryl-alcohol dehydrogenase-like predicted oxidoreductase
MQYRTLGRTGLKVSEIGFGASPGVEANYVHAWDPRAPNSEAQIVDTIRYALERGVNLFDTSQCYGAGHAEELYGRALHDRRDRALIATKTDWRQSITEAEILRRFEDSLRRLQTDYVDLMQFHGDYPDVYRPADVEWILHGGPLDALKKLREQGKVRYLGITCEDATALIPLVESGEFDAIQVNYNVIYQAAYHHLLPACERNNVGVLVMRPNTSGMFQKLVRTWDPAIEQQTDLWALCTTYVLSDPRVTCALVGARSRSTIDKNVALSDDTSRRFDVDWLHDRRVGADRGPRAWVQPQ